MPELLITHPVVSSSNVIRFIWARTSRLLSKSYTAVAAALLCLVMVVLAWLHKNAKRVVREQDIHCLMVHTQIHIIPQIHITVQL